jgi:hypothetical protein
MLEYPKVDRFFVRLDTPGDGIFSLDRYPSDKIALEQQVRSNTRELDILATDLAMNLQFLHPCHVNSTVVGSAQVN